MDAGGNPAQLGVEFLAEPTGRSAGFNNKRRTGFRTIALYAYWRGRALPEDPSSRPAVTRGIWAYRSPTAPTRLSS